MLTLEAMKRLERENRWDEIRRLEPELLANCRSEDLARVHLSLAKAYEVTARTHADYLTAFAHAKACTAAAVPGSLTHTWALHQQAVFRSNLGDFKGAERASREFLAALPHQPLAEMVAPYVYWTLGRIRTRQKRQDEALAYLFRAAAAGLTPEAQERVTLGIVRVLARAGRVAMALARCPERLKHLPQSQLRAARALVFAHAGDWPAALQEAQAAMRGYAAGEWPVSDCLVLAETLLILKRAAQHLGRYDLAKVWAIRSAAIFATGPAGLMTLLQSTLPAGGGEFLHAAIPRCGPAGHHRCGLRGAVG